MSHRVYLGTVTMRWKLKTVHEKRGRNLKRIQEKVKRKFFTFGIKRVILFYFALVFIPLNLYAEEPAFYTIQTGSFTDIKSAQRQFDSIVKKLDEEERSFLRIEKIGKYYSLRLGKFKDHATADEFLRIGRSQLKGAIILKAYIIEDRLIKIYTKDSVPSDMSTPAEPASGTTSDELNDAQSSQQPLPLPGPPEGSVGDAEGDNELKVVQSSQQPLSIAGPDASVPPEGSVMESGDNNEKKAVQPVHKLSPVDDSGIFTNVKGRFYVSDYYSNDSDDFEFHILTSRVNIYKNEDRDSRYYYALDARVRKKIFNGEIKENVPEWRVDDAWLGIKFLKQKLDVIGGRQDIFELYNTTIDGLNVKYTFDSGAGLGIFGGLAPDKQDESLNTDYKSIGGYTFLNKENHKVQFGYEHLSYKGETDREYFSLRIYSKPHEKVRFNAVSSASINQLTDNVEVENANVNLLYRYSRNLRFNIFYNYFRTIKFYQSTREYLVLPDVAESFFLDNNSRTRTGLRVDYKLMKGLKVYSSAAYEKRKMDGEEKLRLTGGVRKYDLFGFDLSGRYTYIDDFSSKSDEFNAEIARNFLNKVDVSVYASREEKKLDAENAFTKRVLTYGTSIYWLISKHYFMTAFLERYKDEDYINISVFTQLGYKF